MLERVINIEIKRNSITVKLFLLIFVLILLISGLIGVWVISDTNKVIQKEMHEMRSQVLNEVANNISILLSNVETIGNNIVVDSKLIDILETPENELPNNKELNKIYNI